MNKLTKKSKKMNNKKGFTLIELIVVIVIIGILAAILIPRFGGFTDKAKKTEAVVQAKQIATAMDAIYAETNAWPATEASLVTISGVDMDAVSITFPDSTGGFKVVIDATSMAAGRTSTGKVAAL